MPQDLYDHVTANMSWRDDLWVFFVFAPLLALALVVIGTFRAGGLVADWMVAAAGRLRQ